MSLIHPWETELQYVNDARKQFESPEKASFPAAQVDIPKEVGNTVLRFVLWTHTSENYADTTAALGGCDIIATEAISTVEDNDATSMQDAQREDARIWQVINRKSVLAAQSEDDAWSVLDTTGHCPAAERYYPLDIGPSHTTEYNELERVEEEAHMQFFKAVFCDNGHAWSTLEEYADNLAQQQVAKMDYREKVTAGQLRVIIAENPGKTIGVLYGRAHATLSRLIDDVEGLSMQRSVRKESVLTEPTGSAGYIYEHAYRAGIVPVYERNSMIIEILAMKYDLEKEYVAHEFNYALLSQTAEKLKNIMKEPVDLLDPCFEEKNRAREERVKGTLVAALVL